MKSKASTQPLRTTRKSSSSLSPSSPSKTNKSNTTNLKNKTAALDSTLLTAETIQLESFIKNRTKFLDEEIEKMRIKLHSPVVNGVGLSGTTSKSRDAGREGGIEEKGGRKGEYEERSTHRYDKDDNRDDYNSRNEGYVRYEGSNDKRNSSRIDDRNDRNERNASGRNLRDNQSRGDDIHRRESDHYDDRNDRSTHSNDRRYSERREEREENRGDGNRYDTRDNRNDDREGNTYDRNTASTYTGVRGSDQIQLSPLPEDLYVRGTRNIPRERSPDREYSRGRERSSSDGEHSKEHSRERSRERSSDREHSRERYDRNDKNDGGERRSENSRYKGKDNHGKTHTENDRNDLETVYELVKDNGVQRRNGISRDVSGEMRNLMERITYGKYG